MKTVYLLSAWALLLLNIILFGIIRALRKRHTREVINLVDDSTTSRDKLEWARKEIQSYQRLQVTDEAMIERLLKNNERDALDKMEQRILLSKYKTLTCFAYERCNKALADMSPGQYQLVREALRQLYNLEIKPDAGKYTRNGPAESGQADPGA